MGDTLKILAISGFTICAISILVAFLAFTKGYRKHLNRIFTLMSISIAIWSFCYGIWLLSKDHDTALFWARSLSLGAIFIPIFHLHWILAFLDIEKRYKKLLWYGYISSFIFVIFSYSHLFVRDVEPTFGFPFWPKPGLLYHIYLFANFIGLHLFGFYKLFEYLKISQGIKRHQVKYVFGGMLIGVIFGSTNFPFWYNINIPPYGNPIVIVYMSIYAYIMIRYRLLDIRIAVRKVFAYIILGAFSYAIFYGVAYTYKIAFGDVFAVQGFVVGTVISFLFAAATPFIFRFAVALSNKFLYTNIYNAQETFRKTTEKLTTIVKLQDLVDLIIITISSTLGIKNAAVLLRSRKRDNTYQVLGNIGFDKKNGISLVRDNFLTRWMDEHAKALVQEELFLYARDARTVAERTEYETLQKRMEGIKAALCLPLIVRGHLYGLIVLGEKKGGEAFTKEDMETLETLSNQAAVALENAVLYNRMEMLVEERTKALEEKNIHLEKLLQMRSEFLDIASHQLRTPVSVIKGYVSMLIDGDYDDTDKQTRKEAYNAIEQKTSKLVQIINDILYASEFDTGGAMLHKREYAVIPINAYVQKIVETHESTAREKHIALIFEQSNEKDLCVRASERYLEVILDNLIDNSLHYTNKNGTITVRVAAFPERVRIEIQDTGIGISKDDQKELFQKFKRGANANNLHTDGSGLGLFIVKKMVESQPDGSVGFESELNQGSTFWIELERAAEKHEA